MKKVIALAAAALLMALGPASVARAEVPDPQLLRTYQPVTHFDPQEAFRPTAVQSFIGDSALEQLTDGHWVVADADPGPGGLPDDGTFRLNQTSCSPSSSIGGLACYRTSWDAWDGGSVVYGRVAHLPDATVLQYWYFYYDDVYSYAYPPSDFIWQAHEGDWEVVNVVLSADQAPLWVGYSQHCSGERRAWADTPRVGGTHPVVHVALGSHANYFSAGTHPISPSCVPAQFIALFIANHLPLPLDYAFPGPVAGPPSSAGPVTPIHRIDDARYAWVGFPGFWGEQEYVHEPAPVGTRPVGTSPPGPAYHPVWTDPLGTLATWPQS